jgi:hypothetical protein
MVLAPESVDAAKKQCEQSPSAYDPLTKPKL